MSTLVAVLLGAFGTILLIGVLIAIVLSLYSLKNKNQVLKDNHAKIQAIETARHINNDKLNKIS